MFKIHYEPVILAYIVRLNWGREVFKVNDDALLNYQRINCLPTTTKQRIHSIDP